MLQRLYPPLRPQSIGEVLDTAFQIFALSLLKTLPYGILTILAGQLGNIYNLATGHALGPWPHDAPSALVYVMSLILVPMLWTAMILRQRAIAQAESISMRAELARALGTIPALLPLAIFMTLAVAVGIVALVLPGIYLLVALSMAVPALILEKKGPIDAMRFSVQLTRDRWWRTLAIFLVTGVIVIVFYILAVVLVAIAVQFARGADVALVTATATVLIIAVGAFSSPFAAATALAVFGELQVRHAAAAPAEAEH